MMFKTHVTSSLSVGLLPFTLQPNLINELGLLSFQAYLFGLILGASFPDIDEPNSAVSIRVNRFLPFLPHLINLIFGHRGITHRFIFFLAFFIASLFVNSFFQNHEYHLILFLSSLGFSFGILFHQLGDMLAGSKRYKGGIRAYFYPFINDYNKYFTPFPYFLRCKVFGVKEHLYLVLFAISVVFQYIQILESLHF